MSYILDALRKAEQERQTKRTPDLHSVHTGTLTGHKSSAKWLWAVVLIILLLMINAMAWWWQSRESGSSEAKIVPDLSETSTQPQQPARAVPTAEKVDVAPTSAAGVTQAETPATIRPLPVQELWQVASHIKAAVQDLKFSFHVYSSNPQRRTIIINNNRMREGDQITADLTLEQITEDGVILKHPDTRVHVAILEQW